MAPLALAVHLHGHWSMQAAVYQTWDVNLIWIQNLLRLLIQVVTKLIY